VSDEQFTADQIRRAVVQQLEALRRTGLTHWKRIDPAPVAAMAASPVAPAATSRQTPTSGYEERPKAAIPTVTTAVASHSPSPIPQPPIKVNLFGEVESPAESPEVPKKKTVAATPVPALCAAFEPLNLPLAERVSGLAALQARVAKCTRCSELASTRTQTVFGVGNPQAKILFVGEAPGADEDKQGEPFVGKSGQLLNDIIKACRMKREDIYICNVLRCRPPSNRLPAPDEAANCREFLDGQIAHVNPEYIVCWGACAAQNLLSKTESIGKLRGQFFQYGNAKVICTYHPSYLMRNPAAKKDVWDDMKLLFMDMGIDLSKK